MQLINFIAQIMNSLLSPIVSMKPLEKLDVGSLRIHPDFISALLKVKVFGL